MATTAGDIYVRSGASGSFTEITYVQGGWVTVASSSTMYSLYHDRLKSGQIVYVQSQNQLYVTSKFVAFETPGYAGLDDSASFATFQFPSSGSASIPSGTISSSTQIAAFGYLTSASAIAAGFGSGGGGSTDISALNLFTGSAQTSLTSLNAATSSYALKTDISGAFTSVSSSISTRLTSVEGGGVAAATESIVTSVVTNNGSSYYIIDDIEKPKLSFAPGLTYRFNLSGIVGSHPFKFSTSLNGPTQYTTGVTSGSGFIQIEVGYNTTTPLYYYCTNHNGMGNEINVLQIEKLITNSQTSSMSVLSSLTASFISSTFISASAAASGFGTALFPSGLLSSSFQIATDISGAFTSLSSSFQSRINSLEVGGGSSIFKLTGSFYSTTNNIQITGSLSISSGSFKSFEVNSDGFVVLGDMNKDLNNAPIGTIAYSASSFYLIS